MRDFIDGLQNIANNNHIGGSERLRPVSASLVRDAAETLGGTIVLDCADYAGERYMLICEGKHSPEATGEYAAIHICQGVESPLLVNFLASIERGTFNDCFACFCEWMRIETGEVA